jgi:lipopolysaccharide/colanic/teichoic acid biosynthesis glycosyltransferase
MSWLQPPSRITKKIIDVVGSSLLIVCFAPVLIVIAIVIRVVDGSPVIYRRRVLGTNGEFDAFKFRSMRTDADAILRRDAALQESFTQNFKLKSDPRVTKLGSVLRKYSLDEFPQLFNVLFGQMSLVGPRMITAPELQKYGPHRELLLTVKPGITGPWQVFGRQEVTYAERVRMDLEYINNWRLKTDLKILGLTPWVVVTGKGAY